MIELLLSDGHRLWLGKHKGESDTHSGGGVLWGVSTGNLQDMTHVSPGSRTEHGTRGAQLTSVR